MTSEVRYSNSDIHTNFLYLALQPKVSSEVIDRVVNRNLFATKTEEGHVVHDPQFSLKTIDLSQYMPHQNRVNGDLHCKDGKIYCRDNVGIFILDLSTEEIKRIPIVDAHAVHIQGVKACFVRDQEIEIIDLNTGDTIVTLENPSSQQVRRINVGNFHYDFDIQMTDSHLVIGYPPGDACNISKPVIVWDYRNETILDQIVPFDRPTKASAYAVKHLTDDAFYSVFGPYGEGMIQKWDLHNPDTPPVAVKACKCTYGLLAFQKSLVAGHEKFLSVYDASDLNFSHYSERFTMNYRARYLLPFGNSILCNLISDANYVGIGAKSIDSNRVEIVLDGLKIDGIKSQICVYNTLGIGKLVVGTMDSKVHVLDFLSKQEV